MEFTDEFGNVFKIEIDDNETSGTETETETERVFSEDEIEHLLSLN